jgi:hypothetical protein
MEEGNGMYELRYHSDGGLLSVCQISKFKFILLIHDRDRLVQTFTMAPNRAGTGLLLRSKGYRGSARALHEPQPHILLNPAIKAYCKWKPELDENSPEWLSTPEVPTPREIAGLLDGVQVQSEIALKPNANEEPFEDKEDYLETFYCLLREDLVEPLRDAVFEVRRKPDLMEDQSEASAHIYEGVSRK